MENERSWKWGFIDWRDQYLDLSFQREKVER